MRKSRLTEVQIVRMIKEQDAGMMTAVVCRGKTSGSISEPEAIALNNHAKTTERTTDADLFRSFRSRALLYKRCC